MEGDEDELRALLLWCCLLLPPPPPPPPPPPAPLPPLLNMAKIGFIFFFPAAEVLCERDLALLMACSELTMSVARGEKSVKIPSPEEQFL